MEYSLTFVEGTKLRSTSMKAGLPSRGGLSHRGEKAQPKLYGIQQGQLQSLVAGKEGLLAVIWAAQ